VITRNNVVILGTITLFFTITGTILSDAFSPISESIRDVISPPPNVSFIKGTIFRDGNENTTTIVESYDIIPVNAITFYFESQKTNNTLFDFILSKVISKQEDQYQCSLDGQVFEDCISPKSYGNLNTEQTHTFQVRAKGTLGNTQNIPEKFKFTSVTSSNIIGSLKHFPITDEKTMKVYLSNYTGTFDETDNKGGFVLQDIRQGVHTLIFNNSKTPECTIYTTFIPPGDRFKDVGILNYSELAFEASLCEKREGVKSPNQSIGNKSEFNPSEDNPLYEAAQNDITKNISIRTNSKNISASQDYFKTYICVNGSKEDIKQVDNVTYYLHPTFTPSILQSNKTDTNFTVSINNWGIFDLKAKVFFKDGSIMDTDLSREEWKKEINNIIDNEKNSCNSINS
jgi:hypothetical protein